MLSLALLRSCQTNAPCNMMIGAADTYIGPTVYYTLWRGYLPDSDCDAVEIPDWRAWRKP